MNFGDAIKAIRKQKNLTQEDLYRGFCSRKQISRIENNKSNPSIEMIIHITNVLQISLDELIEKAKELNDVEFN